MSKKRKVIKKVIGWLVFLGIIGSLVFGALATGLKVSPIMSESMTPSIQFADAAVYVSPQLIEPSEGDIVIFDLVMPGDVPALPLIHRWVETKDGGLMVTKGDSNEKIDPVFTKISDIKGVHVLTLPTHLLRNQYTIPVAGTILGFVLILFFLSRISRRGDAVEESGNEVMTEVVVVEVILEKSKKNKNKSSKSKKLKKKGKNKSGKKSRLTADAVFLASLNSYAATRNHTYEYADGHGHVENDISAESRIAILAEASHRQEELVSVFPELADFYAYNDYSLPLCVNLAADNRLKATLDDYDFIFDAWIQFTGVVDADHHYPYKSLNKMLRKAS